MTEGIRDFFKMQMTIRELIFLLMACGAIIAAYVDIKAEVNLNTAHRINADVHMPLQKKEVHFVTRREYENTIEKIAEMSDDIREIRNFIIKGKHK